MFDGTVVHGVGLPLEVRDPLCTESFGVLCHWSTPGRYVLLPVLSESTRWGPLVSHAKTGQAADVLECEQKIDFPASANERVRWEDNGRIIESDSFAPSTTLDALYEVARITVNGAAVGILEDIWTYFAMTRVAIEGGVVTARRVEFSAQPTVGVSPSPIPAPGTIPQIIAATIGAPRPFPFTLGQDGQDSAEVSVAWYLRVTGGSQYRDDALTVPLTGVNPSLLPNGRDVVAPWSDNRYAWGSRVGCHKQHVIDGRSTLRLLARVSFNTPSDPDVAWSFQVGGLLAGFAQNAGLHGRALTSATVRSG